jgi:NTE family protein
VTPAPVPNVVVLGVGGILGEAWIWGFLAGAQQATGVDFRKSEAFVGTSAGSIVAAHLAAGAEPQRPRSPGGGGRGGQPADRASALQAGIARAGQLSISAFSPFAAPTLSVATPGGALARAAILGRLPRGEIPLDDLHARIAALDSRFDGRLRVVAVDRATGRRIVFGAPRTPPPAVADAVVASCAIPGVFRPARIGGREYVDGGAWSPTNLDVAAVRRGDRVLCLVPTAALSRSPTLPFRALAAGWRLTTAVEAAAMRRRGAAVTIIGPDAGATAAMGPDPMDPRPRERVLTEGFRQGSARDTAQAGARRG